MNFLLGLRDLTTTSSTGNSIHHVPLGQPTIREWELNSDSTRYDRLQAAPSDSDLVIMWSLWSPISAIIGIFVLLVLLSIVSKRKIRSNPFNLYLVYLMIPDIIFSLGCAVTCTFNALHGAYSSVAMCQAQSFYLVLGVAGNSWLNLMIAREIHSLLKSSFQRIKYTIPTPRQVTFTAVLVYLYAIVLSSAGIWGSHVSWFPHETVSISGLGCFPLEYSVESSIFYFLVFIPLLAGIPLTYVLYICYDIVKRKLMPPSGKRRLLSIYFLRVVAAYVLMWMPHLVLCLAGTGKAWAVFAGGTWGHLQGAVSAFVSLTKPDIRKAFLDFIFWRSSEQEKTAGTDGIIVSRHRVRLRDVAQHDVSSETASGKSELDEYMPRQREDCTFDDECGDEAIINSNTNGDDKQEEEAAPTSGVAQHETV